VGIMQTMETPLANGENKKFSFDVLSSDENEAIQGINYAKLPKTFSLSQTVFEACIDVYAAFERYQPRHQSEAKRRLADYFKSIDGIADGYDLEFIERSQDPWHDVEKNQEFGLQFYLDKQELVRGKVHTGGRRKITLRANLDGIPDNKSVVQIHSHPNEMPQSVGDVRGMIVDSKFVPERCLYTVVTANFLHVMFPTNQTNRYDFDEFNDLFERKFESSYDEILSATNNYEQAHATLMRTMSEHFRLGYYSGPKDLILPRII
jgi:hypothetical protein